MTDKPTARAIATRPACGAENSAEPHTAVTSENVPTNSAANSRCIVGPPYLEVESRRHASTISRQEQLAVSADVDAGFQNYLNLFAVFCRPARLERVGLRHGDDVVSRINEVNLAGDAARKVGQEVKPSTTQFLEGHAAAERRISLLEREHVTRVGNTGAGERADRASRDRVDADLLRPKVDCKVPH